MNLFQSSIIWPDWDHATCVIPLIWWSEAAGDFGMNLMKIRITGYSSSSQDKQATSYIVATRARAEGTLIIFGYN